MSGANITIQHLTQPQITVQHEDRTVVVQRTERPVRIGAPSPTSGESNTGANVGGGLGWFRDKTAFTLNFRTITATLPAVVAQIGDTIEISVPAQVASSEIPSIDGELVLFDGVTGQLVKGGSGWTVAAGNLVPAGGNLVDGRDISADGATLDAHIANVSNPHVVTLEQARTAGNIVSGVIDMNGNRIANLADAIVPTDAASLQTVINLFDNFHEKPPAIVATLPGDGNITLSGLQTIDTIVLVDGDRVLLTDQTSGIENGLWEARVGAWTRPSDFDTGGSAAAATVSIQGGGPASDNTRFQCFNDIGSDVIDTDSLDIQQIGGLSQVIAGAGLTKTGNTLDVGANADGSIIINADDVQVGILATDAQHGARGGGTQHIVATGAVAGFMSAADKTRHDAHLNPIATTNPHLVTLTQAYVAGGGVLSLNTSQNEFDIDGAGLAAGATGTAGPDYMTITRGATNVLNTAFNATDLRATVYSGALNGLDISPDPGLFPDRATISVGVDKLTFLRQDRLITVAVPAGFFAWNSTLTFNTGLVNPTIGGFITLGGTVVYQTNANPFGMGNALLAAFTWSGLNGANLGPGFVFAGNNRFEADGGATTMSQARIYFDNAVYAGVNGGVITGGSIGHVSFYANTTLNLGSVLTLRRALFVPDVGFGAGQSPGGTLATQVGVDIDDLNFATTNTGIRCIMNTGTFIDHTGTTPVNLGGSLFLGAGATVDVELSRGAANRLDLASGDDFRLVDGELQFSGTLERITRAVGLLNLEAATRVTLNAPLQLDSSTVAGVPSAAPAAQMLFITDETGGAVPAFSDGTDWRRVTDRAIIA